ncbi:hypothetical protein NE237_033292 [Protea cynaroides]|uniref:Uncharacterized protein n=1 Tax=Protea cynaroides TaxID=273540 RepID=A0A9Q0R4Q1_9MAGN|nr:hypothetical protein NE237_033292 [Protea cynaroides]
MKVGDFTEIKDIDSTMNRFWSELEEDAWDRKLGSETEEDGGKITDSFDKLKETVGSSEDTSAKTRNVIELKKLQLLKLPHRLRTAGFLQAFTSQITTPLPCGRGQEKVMSNPA